MIAQGVAIAALALTAAPVKLVMTDVTAVRIDAGLAQVLGERVATRVAQRGVQLVTSRDVQKVLGLERERQLVGCSDSACVAEVASALGADALLVVDLARVGAGFLVNVKVLAGDSGRALASWSKDVRSEDQLIEALDAAVDDVIPATLAAFGRQVEPPPPSTSRPRPAWIPIGVGVGALIAGGVCGLLAWRNHEALVAMGPALTYSRADAIAAAGSLQQALGAVLAGLGVAALLAGVLWWVLSS